MGRKPKQSIAHIRGGWTIAELSISYQPATFDLPQISSADDAYKLIRSVWDNERIHLQEQFYAFFFNRNNRMLGYKLISTGTMRACVVDIKLLAGLALVSQCEYVIITHNHPSGCLTPSEQDKAVTQKIKSALALIEVKLLDHFIVTAGGYVSFEEKGWL
ncbi:MAG: JAB domain-containing protein [Flavisolibacter sp.]|nr:JAB domain-containing protein [Flavisolibacter sp.]